MRLTKNNEVWEKNEMLKYGDTRYQKNISDMNLL